MLLFHTFLLTSGCSNNLIWGLLCRGEMNLTFDYDVLKVPRARISKQVARRILVQIILKCHINQIKKTGDLGSSIWKKISQSNYDSPPLTQVDCAHVNMLFRPHCSPYSTPIYDLGLHKWFVVLYKTGRVQHPWNAGLRSPSPRIMRIKMAY